MNRLAQSAALLIMVFGMMSCSSQPGSQASGDGFFVADDSIVLEETGVTVAGVTYYAPGEWNSLGPSGMRKAEYSFGPIEGDTDSATMAVYFFGSGQGGDPHSNLDRWIGQMTQEDGSNSVEKATTKEIAVGDMAVHVVEVTGTYTAGGMGMGTAIEKSGYRLTGVVVEAPEGNLFFKLTGPDKTAAQMTGALASMISKIEKS